VLPRPVSIELTAGEGRSYPAEILVLSTIELGLRTEAPLSQLYRAPFSRRRPSPTVELDLGLLEFLDSSGAGAILRAAERLFSRGQILRLASLPPEIKESWTL